MDSIRDILVVTDMDGTLLGTDNQIAPCDFETIRLFTLLGGNFTVATGRTYASVAMYPELAAIIKPAITCGGTVIYDFQKRRAARSTALPLPGAQQAMRDIMTNFPALGAMVMCEDMNLYKISNSAEIQMLIDVEKMSYYARPWEELPEGWNKVLYAGNAELLREVADFTAQRNYPGIYFLKTNQFYFEMMPKGVSKGSALHDLCAMVGVPVRNTYVIGDYYNDLDMMRQAGHAIAMRNAPQRVLDEADEITGGNDEGGVGQVLYRLLEEYKA